MCIRASNDGANELVHSNVGRLDYLSPLLGVFDNEFPEVSRIHRFCNAADVGEARLVAILILPGLALA
jgi:hypothetical protein